jgi:hypothetical protein
VSFHLNNETTHFDQNSIVLTSRNNIKEKKRKPDDLSSYCSSSSIFVPEKAAQVAIFFRAVNDLSLNQIRQTIHHYDGLTLYYILM